MTRLTHGCLTAALLSAGFALGGCASSESADSRPTESVPTVAAGAEAVPAAPVNEAPEKRNERLMRLEWACDQWWAATQKQEFERQSTMSGLLRTYVGDHFDAVVSDLKFGSPRHRRTMAAALGFSDRIDAVPPLTEALNDQYGEVVQNALVALWHLSRAELIDADGRRPMELMDPERLAPYLRHPKPEIRSNAAMVLSRIVSPTTSRGLLLVLVGAAEDSDPATRSHAVSALGAVGDREVFPYLVKALHDPVQLVRIRAALALGRTKDPEAVGYLLATLSDGAEKTDVKRTAAKSLSEILGENADTLDARIWEKLARDKGVLK